VAIGLLFFSPKEGGKKYDYYRKYKGKKTTREYICLPLFLFSPLLKETLSKNGVSAIPSEEYIKGPRRRSERDERKNKKKKGSPHGRSKMSVEILGRLFQSFSFVKCGLTVQENKSIVGDF
jgi:hypothetical protein